MPHIAMKASTTLSPIRVRTQRPEYPDNLGHFFLALDPAQVREEGALEDDLDAAMDVLHATPPADPALPVLVAGEPEARSRGTRLRDGIPLPETLITQLRAVCERAGTACLLLP